MIELCEKQAQNLCHPYATMNATNAPLKGRKTEKHRHFVTKVLYSWGTCATVMHVYLHMPQGKQLWVPFLISSSGYFIVRH